MFLNVLFEITVVALSLVVHVPHAKPIEGFVAILVLFNTMFSAVHPVIVLLVDTKPVIAPIAP